METKETKELTNNTGGPTSSKVDTQKMLIRNTVKSIYDIQKLRIMTGNRIASNFNIKLGQDPGTSQEDMDDEAKTLLDSLRKEYKRITDAYIDNKITIRKAVANNEGIITDIFEYELMQSYMQLLESEQNAIKSLDRVVKSHPLWKEFLSKVKGVGPLMAGGIISEFDPHKAKYPSSFWKYAGLDVVKVTNEEGQIIGEGRGRRKNHLENKVYTNSKGEQTITKGITYNPFLKTKLLGVLGTSFLRSKSQYSDIYYNYRKRLDNTPNLDISDGHKHARAIRYMIKMFVLDLWIVWREIEGLATPEPYYVSKLGMEKHKNTILDQIRAQT